MIRYTFRLLTFSLPLLFFFLFPCDLFAEASSTTSLSSLVESKLPALSPSQPELLSFRYQLRIIAFLFGVSLIPFAVMMLTSFTRISIIFHFLRQALGSSQVPSNQIVIGISLILTGFVMHPVINDIYDNAIVPYINNTLHTVPEISTEHKTEETAFVERAWKPLRTFLLQHSREADLQLFLDIAEVKLEPIHHSTTGAATYNLNEIPWYCIVPSFVMSELRLAFTIGFLLFLPFLIIDMVVASVLMSMGMMMLPPILVSTPFKLLLFVMIDGWRLIIQQVVNGYYI